MSDEHTERGFDVEYRDDAIAIVTLNRPHLHNRFDDLLHSSLPPVLRELRGSRSVRAIVLASTGKSFSAGGDTALMRTANGQLAERRRIVDQGRELLDELLRVPQPIVVALHGAAIGLGATIVLACDMIVAARTASLSDPHVRIGLVAGDGGCLVWPQAVGMLVAKRHLLTGTPLTAEAAHRAGLVTDLVDTADEALPAAISLAREIAALPPLAVQGTKRALNAVLRARAEEVVDYAFSLEVDTLGSSDLLEAISAFEQRRPGVFTGD